MTGVLGNGVGLTLVLAHVGVHKRDNVGADGGKEDSGEGNLHN